jgi:hypothetical protein
MTLNFKFDSTKSIEFGVGHEVEDEELFSLVSVDKNVKTALREMAENTWNVMQSGDDPEEYQPSEKHTSQEYVFVAIDSELAMRIKNLHQATNLSLNAIALENPETILCYFSRMINSKGKRLTAIKRASQFKGIVKKRLVQFVTDTLKLVEDRTFKLDNDFDMLVDSEHIHILRPSGFEFIGELQEVIRKAVPSNVEAIRKEMPFVDFSNIESYAGNHTRAARHLASIRSQRETQNISQSLLKKACKTHGIDLHVKDGKITIPAGHEMDFLDVLDRRRYELELVEGAPERYRAGSRRKVEN